MQLTDRLNKLKADYRAEGINGVALAALVLLDENNEVKIDARDLPGTLNRLLEAGAAAASSGVIGVVIFTALDVSGGGGATVVSANGIFAGIASNAFAIDGTSVFALFPTPLANVNYFAIAADAHGTVKSPIPGSNIALDHVKVDGLTIANGNQLRLVVYR